MSGLKKGKFGKRVKAAVGKKYGSWFVVGYFRKERHTYFLCKCDCGKLQEVFSGNVLSDKTASCVKCARKRISEEKRIVPHDEQWKINRWYVIKSKGLLCERWKNPALFVKDIGDEWTQTHYLCRKDTLKPFSPDNYMLFRNP